MQFGLVTCCYCSIFGPDPQFILDFIHFMEAFAALMFLIVLLRQRVQQSAAMYEACQYVANQLMQDAGGTLHWRDRTFVYLPKEGVCVEVHGFRPRIIIEIQRTFSFSGMPKSLRKVRSFQTLHRALKSAGFSLHIHRSGLIVEKRLQPGEFLESWVMNHVQLALDIAAVAGRFVDVPMIRKSSDEHCAFCHSSLSDEASTYCALCNTPHHSECFAMNGRCSVFGCIGAKAS